MSSSVYLFCFIFYSSFINLMIFKNRANGTLIFSLSLDAFLLSVLLGLSVYYDKIEMVIWNIVLTFIIAIIFIICWVVRKYIPPNRMKELDFMMENKTHERETIIIYLKKHYINIKKYIMILAVIYVIYNFIIYPLVSDVYIFKVMEEISPRMEGPLPHIWIGILLVSTYVAANFNLKSMECYR